MSYLDVEELEGDIWVFDTSSLIHVKELIKPVRRQDILDAPYYIVREG